MFVSIRTVCILTSIQVGPYVFALEDMNLPTWLPKICSSSAFSCVCELFRDLLVVCLPVLARTHARPRPSLGANANGVPVVSEEAQVQRTATLLPVP